MSALSTPELDTPLRTRGRPMHTGDIVDVQVHLRLRVGEDDDLIAFFQQVPTRQRVLRIKQMLRTGGTGLLLDNATDDNESELELGDLLF